MDTQSKEFGISIVEILKLLFSYKFTIILITAIFFILGYFYNSFDKDNYLVKVDIKPILEEDMSNHQRLSYLIHEKSFESEKFFTIFLSEFEKKDILRKVITSKTNITDLKLIDAVAMQFNISFPKKNPITQDVLQRHHQVEYITDNLLQYSEILDETLQLINSKIKQIVIDELRDHSKNIENEIIDEIDNLEIEQDGYMQFHIDTVNMRIDHLKDQIQVAESLGIKEFREVPDTIIPPPTLNIDADSDYSLLNTHLFFMIYQRLNSEFDFLKGTKGLNKELDLLSERKLNKNNLSEIIYLQKEADYLLKKNELLQQKMFKELNIFKNSDINFIEYDIDLAYISKLNQDLLILFLSITFGLLISIIYVFLWNAYKSETE